MRYRKEEKDVRVKKRMRGEGIGRGFKGNTVGEK
jgi:hypothetical protein